MGGGLEPGLEALEGQMAWDHAVSDVAPAVQVVHRVQWLTELQYSCGSYNTLVEDGLGHY